MKYPRYLGLDLAMGQPGFSVVEVRKRTPHLIVTTHVKTNSKLPHGDRLAHIAAYFDVVFYDFGPFEAIVREKAFHNERVAATEGGYKAAAAIDLCLRGRPILELPNSTVKKALTGNGRASKDEVEAGVKKFFPNHDFEVKDESDATAVILTYLLQKNLIDPV